MPQGKRKYADFDAVTTPQPKAQKYGDFDQATAPQPEVGFWENLQTGIARGALDYVVKPGAALMDALGQAAGGNLQPLSDMTERAGRGLLETASAFDPMGNAYEPTVTAQADRMKELRQRGEARQGETVRLMDQGLRVEEEKDPSLKGRITRGTGAMLTGAVPAIASGVLSGGSIPAVAATTALQSASQPENLALNVGASVVPIPVGRVVAPLLRKIRSGRSLPTQPSTLTTAEVAGAKPILSEIKAADDLLPPVHKTVRSEIDNIPTLSPVDESLHSLSTSLSTRGPRAAFDAELESIPMENLFRDASASTPSLGKAIGRGFGTTSQAMRTLWTSMDMSSPLSQGAILSIAHPVKAARSFKMMFKSLSKKQSEAIDSEILNNPLLQLGEDHGLYVATSAKAKGMPEEFFALEALNKLPGIRHSERTFRSYLDTLRLSTWESYVKSLQRAGFTPQNNPKAFQDAASFINIATGRGSLRPGGKLDKAMDLAGDVLFAPRNLISKFQLLDPVRYATLAPGARKLILRDVTTAFGAMLATASLLKLSGAEVSFYPESDGFMTAKFGNTRYDLTMGSKPQVQFLSRMLMSTYRKATGEGNLPLKSPTDVAGRYARSKLAPILSTGMTFATGRDFKGEPVADKSTGEIIWESSAPLLWRDLLENYEEEGLTGLAKTTPAIFGGRVSIYADKPSSEWIETPPLLRGEQAQANQTRSYLTPKKAESLRDFQGRKSRADEWTTRYGQALIESMLYRSATEEEQGAMLDLFKRRVADLTDEANPDLSKLSAEALIDSIRLKRQREKEKR